MSNRNVSGLHDSDDMEKTNYDRLSDQCHKYSGMLNGELRDALNYVNKFNKDHNFIEQACLDIARSYEEAICATFPMMSYKKTRNIIIICNSYNKKIIEDYEDGDSELKEFGFQIKSFNELCMKLIELYHESENLLSQEMIKLS